MFKSQLVPEIFFFADSISFINNYHLKRHALLSFSNYQSSIIGIKVNPTNVMFSATDDESLCSMLHSSSCVSLKEGSHMLDSLPSSLLALMPHSL